MKRTIRFLSMAAIAVSILSGTASAQSEVGCEMPDNPPQVSGGPSPLGFPVTPLGKPACGVSLNYAPVIASHTPVKQLNIIMHIFQDIGTDPKNLDPNNSAH